MFLESYKSSSTLTPGVLKLTVLEQAFVCKYDSCQKLVDISTFEKWIDLFRNQSSASWNAKLTFVGFFLYKTKKSHDFKAGKKVTSCFNPVDPCRWFCIQFFVFTSNASYKITPRNSEGCAIAYKDSWGYTRTFDVCRRRPKSFRKYISEDTTRNMIHLIYFYYSSHIFLLLILRESSNFSISETNAEYQSFCREAAWPNGQRVGLAIRRSRFGVPLWPLAGFALGRPEFKFSATLVNSQLVAFCQLGFLILLCCIWIICF